MWFSFPMPDWLFPCNTITFQAYFWCSWFCYFYCNILSYRDFPIVWIKKSCVHSPMPVFTKRVMRYPKLSTHKNGLCISAMRSFLLFFSELFLVLDISELDWVNSSSRASDGESKITKYTKRDSIAELIPGTVKPADQP